MTVSATSDCKPDLPSSSRMVRASIGSAGTHVGLTRCNTDHIETQASQNETGNKRTFACHRRCDQVGLPG